MPILTCTGIDQKVLLQMKNSLQQTMADKAQVSKEKVKIMALPVFALTPCPPTMEIQLFERSQEQCNDLAQTLHELLTNHGVHDCQIFYTFLSKKRYYKKGRPLEANPLLFELSSEKSPPEAPPLQ